MRDNMIAAAENVMKMESRISFTSGSVTRVSRMIFILYYISVEIVSIQAGCNDFDARFSTRK